jgi:hypothetical protein
LINYILLMLVLVFNGSLYGVSNKLDLLANIFLLLLNLLLPPLVDFDGLKLGFTQFLLLQLGS